jgi:4-aminobutyrate aminotransferase-like enzyme
VRPDALRVAPPLLVEPDEIDRALKILAGIMGGIMGSAADGTAAGA